MPALTDPNHPAKSKLKILTALMDLLYKPVRDRHRKQIEALILKNTQLQKSGTRAFRYKGELYRSDQAPSGPLMAPMVHPDLAPELEDILREQYEIHQIEEPLVKGFLAKVLNMSSNMEDYFMLLPGCVHGALKNFNVSHQGPRQYPTEAHAAMHLQEHAEHIQKLKERMATNLLFQL